MVQKKLPLINSVHGSETRNIINELIKLFNGMGYTYDEALQMAHDVLNEAKTTNNMNKDVQRQLNAIILENGNSEAEVVQARGTHDVLKNRLDESEEILSGKADGEFFRTKTSTAAPEHINILEGYKGNNINSDVQSATISGGGSLNNENIIGGNTSTVGNSQVPNKADLSGTYAHFSVIGGGYDNVNNALAGVLTGYHCIIEKGATHGTISGGSFHKIKNGDYPTISGGTLNEISGSNSTIAGGTSNLITGDDAVVSGGSSNKANARGAVVSGGANNSASANYSTINGGSDNVVSAASAMVTGGTRNTANGVYSGIFGGIDNLSSGFISTILGGRLNKAVADYSVASGHGAVADKLGQSSKAVGYFSNPGDAQTSELILRTETTDANTKNLGIDNTATVPSMKSGEVWSFKATILASDSTDVKSFEVKGISKFNTGSPVQFIGVTSEVIAESAGASGWSVGTLGGTGTFNIRVTGQASKNIKWISKLELVELKF